MKTKVKTTILAPEAISTWRQEMWQLYSQYYQIGQDIFINRFATNDFYVLYTAENKVVGFTGIRMRPIETAFGLVQTLYIGQTVMHTDFRGRSLLPRTCCRLLFQHLWQNPRQPIYVWCDSLTYKPYLLFANSLKTFYPSRNNPMTPREHAIIQQLGMAYYGENFDANAGTVRKSKNMIVDVSAVITPEHRKNPDIDFFATANPRYVDGYGLLTIALIGWNNFFYLIKKCLRKKFAK